MTLVTNMILRKGSSRNLIGLQRFASSRNRISGGSFQKSFSIITTTDGFRRRSLPVNQNSRAKEISFPWDFVDPSTKFPAQRRFRSALPDEYFDDYDEVAGSTPFLLADIGEGIAEVELLRWFVDEGQVVSEFDPVCEVQSDKATVEITSRFEGKVQKLGHASPGSMIKVGDPILWILEKGSKERSNTVETEASESIVKSSSPPVPEVHSNSLKRTKMSSAPQETRSIHVNVATIQDEAELSFPTDSSKVLTSPAVRKLARDHRLDLSTINGTGPAGRILKGDVLAILQESGASVEVQDTSTVTKNTEELNYHRVGEHEVVPLRGYNRIMADTMTASLKIPHMVYSDEINLNRYVKYKLEQQQLDHQTHQEENKKLLFLPLAIKAASKALEKYPWLNASFDDSTHEVTLWKDHNIGIAMDTPRGLIVPVIKQCQNKTLPELAEELTRLKTSVVDGSGGLPVEDLKDATFTLSNVGAIGGGGTYMSPIVTPPQVAIGALGQIRRLPRFVNPSSTDPTRSQTIEEAHICAVSWAADHRVVDGATVARFHKSFKEYMEDPIKLLLELR